MKKKTIIKTDGESNEIEVPYVEEIDYEEQRYQKEQNKLRKRFYK